MEEAATIYNGIEVVLWSGAGAVIFWRTRHALDPELRRRALVASITLLLFGISDAVEIRTGAWWRPWWLFLWKAACVLVLATLAFAHHRRTRKPRP